MMIGERMGSGTQIWVTGSATVSSRLRDGISHGDGDLGGEEDDPDENDEDWNEDEEEESGESETSSTSYGTLTPRSRSLRRAGGATVPQLLDRRPGTM